MAGETTITVIGNLTDDPELKFTPSGAAVANFTVAQTPRTFDRQTNEWKDGEANFFRCAVWRDQAENVAESLQKGQRVIVTGNLRIRNFERQDGSRGTSVEIQVDEVGPSLRWATSKTSKASRSGGGGFGGGQGPGPQGGGNAGGAPANPWSTQPQQSGPGGGQSDAWGGSGAASDEPPF
ncbi:single-stranded DNA-binding protein [Aeromicrobium sp. CTD01-1L150]|uniref:single-stranded DNA-binding protein n=1 Tax=Aeromicrobium sp. CTD01-1L150 TaxID=3341830 RepID=UPI0035BED7E9